MRENRKRNLIGDPEPRPGIEGGPPRRGAKHVLWLDDDAPERFEYESFFLKHSGYEVTWATSVFAAAENLCRRRFRILLADMVVPLNENAPVTGGAPLVTLISWLRGKEACGVFANNDPADMTKYLWMEKVMPLESNRTIPVRVISAFYDPETFETLNELLKEDSRFELIEKPIDEELLLGALKALGAGT